MFLHDNQSRLEETKLDKVINLFKLQKYYVLYDIHEVKLSDILSSRLHVV